MTAAPVPRRILLVGGGGREHALAWRLAAEDGVEELVALPGSDAIAALPGVRVERAGRPTDPPAVVAAARAAGSDLVVVGPEAPLASGVADALAAAGIPVFGPVAAAARIETSKAFCHEIAAAAGIPMARAGAFGSLDPARAFAAELAAVGDGVVVKADGLAAGKGVAVCDTLAEAEAALAAVFSGGEDPGRPLVVVEERLRGPEASVIAICDARDAVALPAARDHKRLGDGDSGPNTGGMGAYSPLADVPDELVAEAIARFHRPALAELARRGMPFVGALYAGLILTADRGPVLLEFNARFGDPETQAILPRLACPLAPLLLAAAVGRLRDVAASLGVTRDVLPAEPAAAVAIVLVGRDYPVAPSTGDRIEGLAAATRDALVFHAGTRRAADGGWETDGGRILAVVGRGDGLPAARAAAEAAASLVSFAGARRRHDIGAGGGLSLAAAASPAPTGAEVGAPP